MFDLEKALSTAAGNPQLWQTQLSPQIYNLLLKEIPLLQAVGVEKAMSPVHQYRKRTSIPSGWVQGELADADFRTATYELRDVALKIVRSWGGVSSYSQALTAQFVNALQEQISACVSGVANTIEWLMWYGNSAADTYQFDGVEAYVNKDTNAKNAITNGGSNFNIGGAALTLSNLDAMLDKARSFRGGFGDSWMFIMSQPMQSRVSALQTRVTRIVDKYRMEGGFEMETYRGVPIMTTQIFTPLSTSTSPTLSGSAVAGGTLTANTYYYSISSVTLNGEQKAQTTAQSVTTAASNLTARLTWAADANARLYKIWRGSTSTVSAMGLIAVIPAITYDGNGNISGSVTTWDDTGANTLNTAVAPLTGIDEIIGLINVTPGERGNRLVGGVSPLGEPLDSYLSYVPLATTNGSYKFMLEGFLGLRVAYPECNIVGRNARTS